LIGCIKIQTFNFILKNAIPYNPFCNVNNSLINRSWIHKYAKYKREWTTLRDVVGTFWIIFGARMNILFITKDKILELIKQSYGSPQLCWSSSLEWLSFFEHIVQCFKNVSFWYLLLELHRTTYHSNRVEIPRNDHLRDCAQDLEKYKVVKRFMV